MIMSIKEKILTVISPAKLVEANPLRGKEKVIQKGAEWVGFSSCFAFKLLHE